MTVKITFSNANKHSYLGDVNDMQDGTAYMDDSDGRIYIVNKISDVIAFSLDGLTIIFTFSEAQDFKLREVNLEVIVSDI